ncbi:hypothetical protein PV377_21185 [Streptomyces ipomoeae]|uniref:hypothetical protein n=1 Tax=Streptomyces ipomoeae TaxID=103232 RepID=UPI0029AAC613|nr:hypothetical protein [Streptomyces ipomoeae]MDX2841455.1 hypothetical protein [Streptomyces ipomoeae]
MSWHLGRMAALDFESSDKHPETARIVTAALIHVGGGLPTDTRTWLLSPGIPMEPEAIKVHGITDEYAAKHGQPAEHGVGDRAHLVRGPSRLQCVVLGSVRRVLVPRQAVRLRSRPHLVRALLLRHAPPVGGGVLVEDHRVDDPRERLPTDPFEGVAEVPPALVVEEVEVVAAEVVPDQRRSGCDDFGDRLGDLAHTPPEHRPDWVKGLRNRRGPYDRFDDLANVTVEGLHQRQIKWAAEQTASFQEHLRKSDPNATLDGTWPIRPIPAQRGGEA